MGTNTFHLLIADIKNNKLDFIMQKKIAVKIGKGGINNGLILNEAKKRALDCLGMFKKISLEYKVDKIKAVATSAFRSAKNSGELLWEIKKDLGINIDVISGDKEAVLIAKGVRTAMDIGKTPIMIMDIGGGSVEFIIANKTKNLWAKSFEIGGQRLLEKFHKKDPISKEGIDALRYYLEDQLDIVLEMGIKFKIRTLIGSSGTFDTINDIHKARIMDKTKTYSKGHITTQSFLKIYEDLIQKDRIERLLIPGMIEMRVDMIVVATILIKFLIDRLNLNQLKVSPYALKEGFLFDTLGNQ